MTEHVVIVLPLPPQELNPNRKSGTRGGRMKAASCAKAYRRRAMLATEAIGVESGPWKLATVHATFFHAAKRARDDVNHLAMLKPAYDGIVEAGLLEDDDSDHLKTLTPDFKIDRKAPRVELRVERIA